MTLRVVTWNCQHQGFSGRVQGLSDAAVHLEPDILFLQEIPWRGGPKFVEGVVGRLGGAYSAVFQRPPGPQSLTWHGTAIIARGCLEAVPRGWAPDAPLPGLLEAAQLDLDGRRVELWSVHVPNGSSWGWHKIFTLEALHRVLESRKDAPLIIGGDFNCPIFERGAEVLTGAVSVATHEPWGEWIDRFGNHGASKKWDAVEGKFFRGELPVRDIYRETHPLGPERIEEGYSHVAKGERKCRYDHIFASLHFQIVGEPRYVTELLDSNLTSDHAPLMAELELA